ncbi:MAG: SPOR domain-containing protein [Vicinamibacterales bacterium]
MRRYLAIGVATAAVVVGALTAWSWYTASQVSVPVATTASLSIAGPSFSSRAQAVVYADAIERAGHPAFVRFRAAEQRHQVLVGPFVASGEAQAAQRELARRGLADTRLMVDDSMRRDTPQPGVLSWSSRRERTPRVVAAAAPGMLSVVIETDAPPTDVRAERVAARLFDVEVHPAPAMPSPRRWSAPAGTLLLEGVQVLPPRSEDGEGMRIRLEIPAEAITRVRLEARRVYIDLAWPDPPWPQPGGGTATPARRTAPKNDTDVTPAQDERARVDAVVTRFRQVQPFVLSAVDTPDPKVRAAVSRMLADFPEALPAQLREAIVLAKEATAPDFAGDRALQVRRAFELFEKEAGPDYPTSQTPPTTSATIAAARIISR